MRLALLLLLAACADPFSSANPHARPFQPASQVVLDSLWALDEACTGITGDEHRLTFYADAGTTVNDPTPGQGSGSTPVSAFWTEPHTIYLAAADSTDPLWRMLIRHEMLHDLLNTPTHPAIFTTCGLAPRGGY